MSKFELGRNGGLAFSFAAAVLAAVCVQTPAAARIVDEDPSLARHAPAGTGAGGTVASLFGGRSGSQTLSIARRYLGGNPTGQRSRWCADFVNLVEQKAGRDGSGSRAARSYLSYGKKVSKPQPGDIVVLSRVGGGHVGYFMGWKDGKIELLSGNHGKKVGIGTYPTSRVLGYRRPL